MNISKIKSFYNGIIKNNFSFLIKEFLFVENKMRIEKYGVYIGFKSKNVGILIEDEFRESHPLIIFFYAKDAKNMTLQNSRYDVDIKKGGVYMVSLDWILDKEIDYGYNDKETDYMQISSLIKKYAMEFVKGDENAYLKMDNWIRNKINKN